MLTSYIKTKTENSTEYEQKRLLLIEDYEKYKGYIDFPDDLLACQFLLRFEINGICQIRPGYINKKVSKIILLERDK